MPPAVLAGRYELHSELGRGSMGTVWRARDLRFDRMVAVKMVRLGGTAAGFGGQLAGRFDREIMAVGRLNHPNIAVAYDAGREGDQMYLVTELVAGQSLAQLVRERNTDGLGPFPVDAALDIAAQVCAGLAVAHRAGVVHRDLKPANLMVSDAAEVKIVDFGIARLVEDTLPRLTQPGTMVGTLAYGSPEQLEGKVVDGRTDLYALGCMLYELIAGVRPFVAQDAESLMRLHIFSTAVPLTTRRPDCPTGVAALVAELMAKVPEQRPQRAEEVIGRIQELRNPPGHGYRAPAGYDPGGQGYPAAPPDPGYPPQPGTPRQQGHDDVVVPPSRERSTIVVGDDPPRGGPPQGGAQPYPPAGGQQGGGQQGGGRQGGGRHGYPQGGGQAGYPAGQQGYAGGPVPYQGGGAAYQAGPNPYQAGPAAHQGGDYQAGDYQAGGQQGGGYQAGGYQGGGYQSGPAPSPAAVAAWHGDRPEIHDAHRRARFRRSWLLAAGLGVVAIAVVALLVAFGHKPITVRSLTMATPKAAGCNGTVDVVATVVTDGNPGTISYRWSRSDSTDVQSGSVDVPDGQTSTPIHLQWTFKGKGKATFRGTATLKIVSPGSATASAPVSYSCK